MCICVCVCECVCVKPLAGVNWLSMSVAGCYSVLQYVLQRVLQFVVVCGLRLTRANETVESQRDGFT